MIPSPRYLFRRANALALPAPARQPFRLPTFDVKGPLRRQRDRIQAASQRARESARTTAVAARAAQAIEQGKRDALDRASYDLSIDVQDYAMVMGYDGRETHTRVVVIKGRPTNIAAGWFAEFLFDDVEPSDVTVTLQVEPIEYDAAMDMLMAQRTVQHSIQQDLIGMGILPHLEVAGDLAAAAELGPLVRDRKENLFNVNMAVTLRGDSSARLDALERRVRALFGQNQAPMGATKWQQRGAFLSAGVSYPDDHLGRYWPTNTTSLAFSVPWLNRGVGTSHGVYVGYSLEDLSPVFWYPWARQEGWNSGHSVIPAPNGGGKTVLAWTIITGLLALADGPAQIIIVDTIKGDFRKGVTALGGEIVDMSARPDICLNAFDLPDAWYWTGTGERVKRNPVLEQARLCSGFLLLLCKSTSDDDEQALEEAILLAYLKGRPFLADDARGEPYGIDPDKEATWTTDPNRVPILADVIEQLAFVDGGAPLAKKLARYTKGTLRGLFADHTKIKVDAKLVSFDLERMDVRMRPFVVWLIGNYVWQKAKSDRLLRFLYLEEVKTLLEQPETARLVAHLYSLARAYNVAVCSATQRGDDYGTPEGRRAIENAPTHFLLKQPAGSAWAKREHNLPPDACAFLEGCDQGQGIIVTPLGNTRWQCDPSPWVLELIGGDKAPDYDPEHPWINPVAV
jgi:hypothetical protein